MSSMEGPVADGLPGPPRVDGMSNSGPPIRRNWYILVVPRPNRG
jgi:hypothetical protein